MKILIVEDSVLQQKMILAILSSTNYHIDMAVNGHEAIEKFFQDNYDIVFMDIGLPDIDGLEVTRQIRELDQITPIVALSAHDEKEKQKFALSVGMNDYMVKPLTLEKANEIIKKWVVPKAS